MNDINKIATMFYNFVYDYGYNEEQKNYDNNLTLEEKNINSLKNIVCELYKKDTMFFITGKDKETVITDLKDMLKDKEQTELLYNRLENTFDNDLDCYISKIGELDYLTGEFITTDQLSIVVNRKFEFEDDFKEKDYFNLYLKYKKLCGLLESHLKTFC